MVCSLPELSLDLSPPSVKPSFPEFLADFPAGHLEDSCELLKLIHELEDEIKKIQAFQRELPLSFTLLNHAIEKMKEKVKRSEQRGGKQGKLGESVGVKLGNNDVVEKKDWMSSVQLWAPSNEEDGRERKAEGGVISLFNEDEKVPRLSLVMPSAVDQSCKVFRTGGESPGLVVNQTEKLQPKQACQAGSRKQRRCWSPELHRRFLDALDKLGGSQVATPKQIRELMQVDGLTNDEVKSHLQKYRLHIRKPPTRATASSSKTPPLIDQGMGDTLELGYSNSDIQHSCSPEGLSHYVMSKKCNSYSINRDEEENSDGHTSKAQRAC
ncbi:hypothetical protein vseg_005182 [Gypsophila vaccaria]